MLIGVRYFRDANDNADHIGFVRRSADAFLLRVCTFKKHDPAVFEASSWQNAYFHPRLRVSAGEIFVVGVHFPHGLYFANPQALANGDVVNGDLAAPQNTPAFFNGVYTYAADLIPNHQSNSDLYGVDGLFLKDPP